ncbi:MAG: hypothetical protein QOE71_2544 [Pseudonocardiales bacterium]|jgi:hypothetical protein|nr:hypothetical protein [Pseudonocardiales bacterium]
MSKVRAAKEPLTEGGAAAPHGSAAPADGTAPGGDPSRVWAIIGASTSQVVVITALLYYFGWVRSDSELGYFGVDPSLAGYGTVDYVLRSIDVAFPPFIRAAFTALALFAFHRQVVTPTLEDAELEFTTASAPVAETITSPAALRPARSAVMRPVHWAGTLARRRPGICGVRWFVGAVHAAGVALAMVVLTGVLLPERIGVPLGLLMPLLLVAAVTLLGYVTHLRSTYPASLVPTGSRQAPSLACSVMLLALGLVAALWAVSLYGEQVGTDLATDVADHLSAEPSVTIYSTERISIAGPGVVAAEITQPGSRYHYQYSGLRLLLHSPDRYVLLPVGWQHGQDPVFVLHDDVTTRVDITAR